MATKMSKRPWQSIQYLLLLQPYLPALDLRDDLTSMLFVMTLEGMRSEEIPVRIMMAVRFRVVTLSGLGNFWLRSRSQVRDCSLTEINVSVASVKKTGAENGQIILRPQNELNHIVSRLVSLAGELNTTLASLSRYGDKEK